jgi:hypothetical protein
VSAGERRAWREAAKTYEQRALDDAAFADQLATQEYTDEGVLMRSQVNATSLTWATLALLNQQRADADQAHEDRMLLQRTVRNGQ